MSERHEPADIHPRTILWVAATLVAVVSVSAAVLYWLFPRAAPQYEPRARAWTRDVREGPRLQTNPQADWDELRRKQQELLDSYGWVDQRAGVAHIPIQEAMRLLPQSRSEVVIEAEGDAK